MHTSTIETLQHVCWTMDGSAEGQQIIYVRDCRGLV